MRPHLVRSTVLLALPALFVACDDGPSGPGGFNPGDLNCSLDNTFFASGGVPRDGIPALTDPPRTTPDDPSGLGYLDDSDRVVGVFLDGVPLAVPLNILYHHEIVNLSGDTEAIAVTYCPLTGSSLAFDRSTVDGAEFGVSGLLYQSNLIMYDRRTNESLWPQMFAQARCGPQDGQLIARAYAVEMTWEGWRTLHPDTRVLTDQTGHFRDYRRQGNPYRLYEASSEWWFPLPTATGIPGKERVLGIPAADGGVAFAFQTLDILGDDGVVPVTVDGEDLVVFWDGQREAAYAYVPEVDGEALTFQVGANGIEDVETGSEWGVDGVARTGAMAGTRLDHDPDAYTAFWRAWAAFNPDTEIWSPAAEG